LETRINVNVVSGTDVMVRADAVQLEQLLINLIRNAADAALETNGDVEVEWIRQNGQVVVSIKDEGLGLANTTNLFVPFFTTKTTGSGIGLVLSRQIAEAHGGTLSLQNRNDANGCIAKLQLPL
jgi:C4-dicarboxylate-specific signal transduction histidine kinase